MPPCYKQFHFYGRTAFRTTQGLHETFEFFVAEFRARIRATQFQRAGIKKYLTFVMRKLNNAMAEKDTEKSVVLFCDFYIYFVNTIHKQYKFLE